MPWFGASQCFRENCSWVGNCRGHQHMRVQIGNQESIVCPPDDKARDVSVVSEWRQNEGRGPWRRGRRGEEEYTYSTHLLMLHALPIGDKAQGKDWGGWFRRRGRRWWWEGGGALQVRIPSNKSLWEQQSVRNADNMVRDPLAVRPHFYESFESYTEAGKGFRYKI